MLKLKWLVMVILALALAACSTQPEVEDSAVTSTPPATETPALSEAPAFVPLSQDQITNIVWMWSDLTETEPAGQSVIPDSENYTVTFRPDGTAAVKADCNQVNWPYTIEENRITFDALFATTLAECGPDSLSQVFLEKLGSTETADLQNDLLILNLADGAGSMGFVNGGPPAPEGTAPPDVGAADFVGPTWEWEELRDQAAEENDIVVGSPEDYTVRFNADGTAAIRADCNQIRWTYESDGESTLTFNTLGATTLVLCPPGSLDREYLGYLGSTAGYVIEDGKLILNMQADGGNMIFRPAAEQETAVTGTITTDEAVTLPDDAIIQIQIQDTSLADAPATVVGEQILEAAGAQFPIAYRVSYDSADIDDRFSYTMSVRITDGDGQLIFINDTNTPVITNGNPTSDVTITVVPVTPSGGSSGGTDIVGQTWEWEELRDTAAEENDIVVGSPEDYTVRFDEDGTAGIQADCNRLTWTYETDGASLTFNTLGPTTLALCPPGSLDREYLGYLGSTASYVLEDGKLILNLQADGGNMIFRPAAEQETAVSGTITTEEAATLPDDAIIQIQIQDTSMADAPATVVGETILEAAGAQFPIAYRVSYNPADIDDRFSYTMSVRITDGDGQLIFINDTSAPVITRGFPTQDVTINVVPVQ